VSLSRNGFFAGLQLDAELKTRDAEPRRGVQVVDLSTGNNVEWIRL
jgi:hypothetical protein